MHQDRVTGPGPVLKIWSDPGFKIWSDPEPVWKLRSKPPLKLNFSYSIILPKVLKYQLFWRMCRKKKLKGDFIKKKIGRIRIRFFSRWSDPDPGKTNLESQPCFWVNQQRMP